MKGDVKNTYCSGAEKGVLCGWGVSQGLFSARKEVLLVAFFSEGVILKDIALMYSNV